MMVLAEVSGGGDILHQQGRGQVNATLQLHSLSQVKGPANKRHTNQSLLS